MSVYKLMFDGVAAGNAALDIQNDGTIIGIMGSSQVAGATVQDEGFQAEVSFSSSSAFVTNDTKASFFGFGAHLGVVTTGGSDSDKCVSVAGINVKVSAGERIYLHVTPSGTLTQIRVSVWLYIDDGLDTRPSRRTRQG